LRRQTELCPHQPYAATCNGEYVVVEADGKAR
jgi:hypothetical protein